MNTTQATEWLVCSEWQQCIWSGADAIPEVDISESTVHAICNSRDEAIKAIVAILEDNRATKTEADVRPVEECGACGGDFETARRHLAITLIEEPKWDWDEDEAPEPISTDYLARFCPECSKGINLPEAA